MNTEKSRTSKENNSFDENPSSVWANEIELNSKVLRRAARSAGLVRKPGNVRLSLESIDRRRLQIWVLGLIVLLLVCLSMVLLSGVLDLPLPDWIPRPYLVAFIFALASVFGFYALKKESQLRHLSRFLLDEQFHKDVVNRRLKVVETILESSRIANRVTDERQSLDMIVRQARQFFEHGDITIYLKHRNSDIKLFAGNAQSAVEEIARTVVQRNQSQFVSSAEAGSVQVFGVPIATRKKIYGALCLRTNRPGLDSFETLMALSLFAEQASSAIANARARERERISRSKHEYDVMHDAETGLVNRAEFIARLERRIDEFGDDAPLVALLFINIDGLSRINNSLGYDAGDALIRHFSERLHASLPIDAIAGRFAGDEFLMAIFGVSGYDEALLAAESIRKQLGESMTIGSRSVWYSASIGVAMPETWDTNAHLLVREANIAMRKAKADGKGRCARFDASLTDEIEKAINFEVELGRALENDEIDISLQPIFDLRKMVKVGAEALARWNHPEHGSLPATSFLPFITSRNQLELLECRILDKTCHAIRKLREKHIDIPVHANLSARMLASKILVESVRDMLKTHQTDPASLVIEFTEGENPASDEYAQRNVEQLKETGIKIAMDEFGSGASSLEALDRTRVDVVKISRNLVSNLGQSEDSRGELIRTILSLAERLGLEVVAVGVENDRQLELLKEFGCRQGQGFYLGKPVSVSAFIEGIDADAAPDAFRVQAQ